MTSSRTYILKAAGLVLVSLALLLVPGVMSGLLWGDEGAPPVKVPFPKPETHKGDWIRYHGTTVDMNVNKAGQGGRGCYACHDNNDCTECHSLQPPRDHTGFWRTTGHGLSAAASRERCAECHRQDYCVRCHNETTPRSHKGKWKDGGHCTWCHYGSGLAPADTCGICHRQAGHPSAPHAINTSVDCAGCH